MAVPMMPKPRNATVGAAPSAVLEPMSAVAATERATLTPPLLTTLSTQDLCCRCPAGIGTGEVPLGRMGAIPCFVWIDLCCPGRARYLSLVAKCPMLIWLCVFAMMRAAPPSQILLASDDQCGIEHKLLLTAPFTCKVAVTNIITHMAVLFPAPPLVDSLWQSNR